MCYSSFDNQGTPVAKGGAEVVFMKQSDAIAMDGHPGTVPKSNNESQNSRSGHTVSSNDEITQELQFESPIDPIEMSGSHEGVEVTTLQPFDTIVLRTANSSYRLFLLDPGTGHAILQGGQVAEPMEVSVIGSSRLGSSIRSGWIGVGLRVEALANDSYIRTSEVKSVSVEHLTPPDLISDMSQ